MRQHIAVGRWAQLGDMVGPALFLACDAARYVTGQMLVADGGFTTGFKTQ
ncbi:SDR family oxidoreductase [Mesorhizobium sp. M7A.F.Ca.US.006.01.1.1]|nr:SDR family oxidoreductase [Mesorhizobium sp. M7A.F.Ca.US.006.01.1.1]